MTISWAEHEQSLKGDAKLASVIDQLDAIKATATELFDHIDDLRIVDDPDIPHHRYVSMTVTATGTVRKVADLRNEWYRKIQLVLKDNVNLIHLAIDISDDNYLR